MRQALREIKTNDNLDEKVSNQGMKRNVIKWKPDQVERQIHEKTCNKSETDKQICRLMCRSMTAMQRTAL